MSNNAVTCVRSCGRELRYSIPKEESDTITRKKFEEGNRVCKFCAQEQSEKRKREIAEKKRLKKQQQDNIKRLEESKVQTFDRKWRDVDENGNPLMTKNDEGVAIVNLPEHIRLMWTYIKHGLRTSQSGYQTSEEMKVLRREQLQVLVQSAMQAQQRVTNDEVNDVLTKENANIARAEIELNLKIQTKRLISSVEKLHTKANREWADKPEGERERMVKEPDYRDTAGNKALRYHLLSAVEVYHKRRTLRQRQIHIIEHVDQLENQISDKNQKYLRDEGAEQASST